jgi:UDP-perosamine 4-acetyltransferase
MNEQNNIVLVGGGGHAKVIIDAIKCAGKFGIYGIVDSILPEGTSVLGIKVLGGDSELPKIFKQGVKYAFISVGSLGDCSARKRIAENLEKIGFKLPVIAHPKAVIAQDVRLGDGTFVAAAAVINPATKIGKNAIINTSSSIDHDCEIGDFVHIAPGVTLSGCVKIKDEAHIGTGASIVQKITVGAKVMVKAGTTVKHDEFAARTVESKIS